MASRCNRVHSVQVHVLPQHKPIAQETLAWLSNPDNANANILPPGLENFDPMPFFSSAIPIALTTFGAQLLHELGHRVAASKHKVRLHSRVCLHSKLHYTCLR